ncbi:DUF4352 domain-containing protein [Actinoplanes philippinensis]|uniref:DUF4352 domain-containing protein n=1 Tax=Actinoplanes philippinensis TaxID=35752 RepID=UPI00116086E1|nr:DUF4352 domain-containing protein [Actinoplanes philippinensis]
MIIKGIDLAADEPPARRRRAMVEAVIFGFAGLVFVFAPVVIAGEFDDFADRARRISGPDTDVPGMSPLLMAVPIGIGLLLVSLSVVLMLRMVRSAAWLDGTVAYVRGAFRTRSIDLSTAYVSAGTATRHEAAGRSHTAAGTVHHVAVREVPTLEAHDPVSGRKLTIHLCRPGGGAIPPYALRALADAMVRGRGRNGNDHDVHQLAHRLRRIVDGDRVTEQPADGGYGPYRTAADPWQGHAPQDPAGYGPGPAEPVTTGLGGTPTPVRRQTDTGLRVMVTMLAVLLLAGLGTAGAIYGSMLARGSGGTPAEAAGAASAKPTGGGGSPAEEKPAQQQKPSTLAAGKAVVVEYGGGTVRIKVDKIATHKSFCGSTGLPPDNGGYVTARISYEVISGATTISPLDFGFVDSDGTPYERVGAGFTGCGGSDLAVSGDQAAGAKVSGYVGFDAPAHGLITFGDRKRQAAWRVG